MIEKMKFLRITGPKSDFDRFIDVYLSKYDIHLENALSELSSVHDLKPFVEVNPYKDLLGKSDELVKLLNRYQDNSDGQKIQNNGKNRHLPTEPDNSKNTMTPPAASEIIASVYSIYNELAGKRDELKSERNHYTELIQQIEPFRNLDTDIHRILDLKFINFRFGRISHEFYNKFSKYISDNLTSFFYECDRDRDYVWGVYFVPAAYSVKIDAIYASLHFEQISLSDEYEGTPEEAYQSLLLKRNGVNDKLADLYNQLKDVLGRKSEELITAHHVLYRFTKSYDVRKMAACTKEKGKDEVFYILCGWIPDKDVNSFLADVKKDPNVNCITEDAGDNAASKPPTRLKNPKLFKPFEMFVKMYGVPAYNEIDPTSFVAVTYSLIFGIMFGDVGQGLCLAIGGALLYKLKKMNLAAIISMAGIFSTIFGFLYGSVFGFEDWLKPAWLAPMHNVKTVLFTAIGFGVVLILIAMILNIVNGIKEKDFSKIFFDTNGVSGLIFYGAAITCVVFGATGHALPAAIVLVIFFAIPLLLIFFKEPLTRLMEKKTHILPEHKIMFFVESIFEMFEVLLSYVTNTISFLRVGAFALSHAAMMGVVLLLAKVSSGHPNIVMLVFGNIFVAAMEGLIVGIQVLRLEYYEMFSRFYKGTGKEFKPYKNN